MAETKRKKNKIVVTPKGKAFFPHLNTPNTKFNPDGVYDIKLILEADNEEAIEFMKLINEATAENLESVKAELKEKGAKGKAALKKLTEQMPYEDQYDDEGNETGNIYVKAKLDAQYTNAKKEIVVQQPTLVDSQGKPLKKGTLIYGGSILRLRVGLSPYYIPATGMVGVSLRLWAVQVVELVTSGSSTNGGFDAIEGGYSAEDDDNDYSTSSAVEDTSTDEEGDNGNPEDF